MPYVLALVNMLAGFFMACAAVDAFQHIDRPNRSGGAFWLILAIVVFINGLRLWP